MNRRFLIAIVSSAFGLLAAGAYTARIQNLRAEITTLTRRTDVLTAARPLAAGELLRASDLISEPRLEKELSARSIFPEELNLVPGQRVFHPVPAGEVILWTDLSEGPRLRKPSEKIPEGFRAIALPADETHTMVHFISPGDEVDLVWTDFSGEGSKIDSRLIARKVRVLGVGQKLEEWSRPKPEEDYPMSVTLLVTQETGLSILEASQTGEIHFLARGSSLFSGDARNEADPEK